ncbi:MAG TPA: hypothetical protein PKO36_01190, partial [Candidatus Hydrogenedentes bacterium]|nr:hypothetical protein [Candidatus Hydrogenedentota bacterium]
EGEGEYEWSSSAYVRIERVDDSGKVTLANKCASLDINENGSINVTGKTIALSSDADATVNIDNDANVDISGNSVNLSSDSGSGLSVASDGSVIIQLVPAS